VDFIVVRYQQLNDNREGGRDIAPVYSQRGQQEH